MNVLIKFKDLNMSCIEVIMREKLGYILSKFEEDTGRDNFLFSSGDFLRRVGRVTYMQFSDLDTEVQRVASRIGGYDFVSDVGLRWEQIVDRYTIEVRGKADCFHDSFYGGYIEPFNPEPIRRYFESDRKAVLDAYKRDTMHLRIPKTFDVYSGYSRDGRLRTIVHWEDGVKTDVYLQNEDFDDIYLAIAYCYVKRRFGTMSHFKRIVERNTKDVTANVKRFIYGSDSTILISVVPYSMFSIYDQVALYLAISYLGDTSEWLTEEEILRLEESMHE